MLEYVDCKLLQKWLEAKMKNLEIFNIQSNESVVIPAAVRQLRLTAKSVRLKQNVIKLTFH